MDKVTATEVQDIINMNGIVFTYPRKGMVSINGGRLKEATQEALKLAQANIKARKQQSN